MAFTEALICEKICVEIVNFSTNQNARNQSGLISAVNLINRTQPGANVLDKWQFHFSIAELHCTEIKQSDWLL